MWIEYNPNPSKRRVDDCAARALCRALNVTWDKAYAMLCAEGFKQSDMPHSNAVWGAILKREGFSRSIIPNTCPDCYTVREFIADNPKGVYVVASHDHVATIVDGNLYDSWDSLDKVPQYYWCRSK